VRNRFDTGLVRILMSSTTLKTHKPVTNQQGIPYGIR